MKTDKKKHVVTTDCDPPWIIKLNQDIDSINSEEGVKLLKKLFNDYLSEGMQPREALEKSKMTIKSFNL